MSRVCFWRTGTLINHGLKCQLGLKRKRALVLCGALLIVLVLLLPAIRGDFESSTGRLRYQSNDYSTQPLSPYESSGSSARYATVESIVRHGQLNFTPEQKAYASPDIILANGKYSSLFTPGVAFLAVPFYIVGSLFMIPQIGAYSLNIAAALVCFLLIYLVVQKLGGNPWFAYLSGFSFVFGTSALVYAGSLTQHLLSTSLILFLILLASSKETPLRRFFAGLVFGLGVLVDIPNLFLMSPAILYIFFQVVRDVKRGFIKREKRLKALSGALALCLGLGLCFGVFLLHNAKLYGSPFTIAQMIGRPPETLSPEARRELSKSNNGPEPLSEKVPFQTRNLTQGFLVFATSDERSFLYYAPIVLVGAIGLVLFYRRSSVRPLLVLLISHIVMNILTYSMFGDPWGGWAYGPRYLIPTAAICCAGLAFLYSKNRVIVSVMMAILIVCTLTQSIWISTLGALSTSQIPPKQEVQRLADPIPHTYEYAEQFLEKNLSSSLVANFLKTKGISSRSFHVIYATLLMMVATCIVIWGYATLLRGKNDPSSLRLNEEVSK